MRSTATCVTPSNPPPPPPTRTTFLLGPLFHLPCPNPGRPPNTSSSLSFYPFLQSPPSPPLPARPLLYSFRPSLPWTPFLGLHWTQLFVNSTHSSPSFCSFLQSVLTPPPPLLYPFVRLFFGPLFRPLTLHFPANIAQPPPILSPCARSSALPPSRPPAPSLSPLCPCKHPSVPFLLPSCLPIYLHFSPSCPYSLLLSPPS